MWWGLVAAVLAGDGEGSEVLGWTADGGLVYRHLEEQWLSPPPDGDVDPDDLRQRRWWTVRLDATGKEAERWLIRQQLPPHVEAEAPVQAEAFDRWRKAHRLAGATASRTGPQGLKVHCEGRPADGAEEVDGDGVWQGADFRIGALDAVRLTCRLARGDQGGWPLHQEELHGSAFGPHSFTLTAHFSPDGRSVAVVRQRAPRMTMRGELPAEFEVHLRPAAPLISVLAPKAATAERRKVEEAVRSLGRGVVATGEAMKARERSVVYFADGFEGDARAVAAAVPGGAEVAPMDWKGPQHLVVAVGSSAR